jgi:hypothetical protein
MRRSRLRRRRERRFPPTIVLPWLATAAILVATATFAFWPREPELRQPKKPGESGALIWGEGVFSSALELKAWLEARGVNYKEWARRHPEAVELLVAETGTISVAKPKPAKPKAAATTPGRAATTPAAKQPSRPASEAAAPPDRELEPAARTFAPANSDSTWLVVALLALLISVGGAIAASVSKLGASSRATGVGVGLMLSGMCIGIGFAAAALLS